MLSYRHTQRRDGIVQLNAEIQMNKCSRRSQRIMDMVEIENDSYTKRMLRCEQIKLAARNFVSDEFAAKLKKGRNWRGRVDVDHKEERVCLSVAANKGASSMFKL